MTEYFILIRNEAIAQIAKKYKDNPLIKYLNLFWSSELGTGETGSEFRFSSSELGTGGTGSEFRFFKIRNTDLVTEYFLL